MTFRLAPPATDTKEGGMSRGRTFRIVGSVVPSRVSKRIHSNRGLAVTHEATRDLEARIRLFAHQHRRPPTPGEVRLLMAELGVSRNAVAKLAESARSPGKGPVSGSTAESRRDPPGAVLSSSPSVETTSLPNAAHGRGARSEDRHRPAHETAAAREGLLAHLGESGLQGDFLPPAADADVRRAVDDLTDDWHRQGGGLGDEDVTRLVSKRALSAFQHAAILTALSDLGIATDPTTTGSVRPAAYEEPVSPDMRPSTVTSDQLKDYLKAIGRTPLLFAEDEVRLGRAIQAGLEAETASAAGSSDLPRTTRVDLESIAAVGRQAQRDLVQANLRLVVSIAKLRIYEGQGLDLSERIQEGNLGLMRAAVKFDPELGYKFSTYATWWVRQSIGRGLADRGRSIRLPVHVVENLRKVKRAQRSLFSRYDREPALPELAEVTGLAEATVRAILDYDRRVVSLDAPVTGAGDDLTFGDLLSDVADVDGRNDPADCALASAMHRDINELLGSVLDDRARDVLEGRNGYDGGVPKTLGELGHTWGVTRERIRQVESKAYSILRGTRGVESLYEYLCDDPSDHPPRPKAKPVQGTKKRRGRARIDQPASGCGNDQQPDIDRERDIATAGHGCTPPAEVRFSLVDATDSAGTSRESSGGH